MESNIDVGPSKVYTRGYLRLPSVSRLLMSVYLQTRYVSLILGIVGLYVSTIAIGTNLCAFKHSGHSIKQHEMWKRPSVDTILNVSQKADVVRGQLLFTETHLWGNLCTCKVKLLKLPRRRRNPTFCIARRWNFTAFPHVQRAGRSLD